MTTFDYSDAPPPRGDELIPHGTIATVQMRVRGGNAGEDGMLIIEARKEQWKNPAYDPNAKAKGGGRRGEDLSSNRSLSGVGREHRGLHPDETTCARSGE